VDRAALSHFLTDPDGRHLVLPAGNFSLDQRTFSVIEIAMTVIVGVTSLAGIVSFARFRSSLSPAVAAVLFIGLGAGSVCLLPNQLLPGDRTPLN
jgi:hypothetical protein